MRRLLFILSLLIIPIVGAEIKLNEIMPDPDDGCSDCTEWIELASTESMSLSNWILVVGTKSIKLNETITDFLIITKNKSEFLKKWAIDSNKVIEKPITLSNSGKSISLSYAGETKDSYTYPKVKKAQCLGLINGEWKDVDPTPGTANQQLQSAAEPPQEPEDEDKGIGEDLPNTETNTSMQEELQKEAEPIIEEGTDTVSETKEKTSEVSKTESKSDNSKVTGQTIYLQNKGGDLNQTALILIIAQLIVIVILVLSLLRNE